MRKVLRYVVLVCVAFAVLALPAFADPPWPDNPAGHENDILGVTPSKNASHSSSGGNLVYHGGSVMHANRTYAIYWEPSGSTVTPAYNQTISTFLADVAADSGKTTNVYYSNSQYTDGGGAAAYASTYGRLVRRHEAVPGERVHRRLHVDLPQRRAAPGRDRHGRRRRTAGRAAWARSTSSSRRGAWAVATRARAARSRATARTTAASGSGSSRDALREPAVHGDRADACDTGKAPNGDQAADSTINVVSHEHSEAITDGLGNAWYDRAGYENGDKCAWNFGARRPGNYNQTINGHHYYLQQEWSNARSGCVLTGRRLGEHPFDRVRWGRRWTSSAPAARSSAPCPSTSRAPSRRRSPPRSSTRSRRGEHLVAEAGHRRREEPRLPDPGARVGAARRRRDRDEGAPGAAARQGRARSRPRAIGRDGRRRASSRAARTTSAGGSCRASSRSCSRAATTARRGRRCRAGSTRPRPATAPSSTIEPSDALWGELSVGPDRCSGRRCPFVSRLLRGGGARPRRARPTS